MGTLEYRTNNSGGGWWLKDKDWHALDKAGWIVHWVHDLNDPSHTHTSNLDSNSSVFNTHTHEWDEEHKLTKVEPNGDTYMDALAVSAIKITDDPQAAIREFELLASQNAADLGCGCCGPPHSFTFVDDAGKTHYIDIDVQTSLNWDWD